MPQRDYTRVKNGTAASATAASLCFLSPRITRKGPNMSYSNFDTRFALSNTRGLDDIAAHTHSVRVFVQRFLSYPPITYVVCRIWWGLLQWLPPPKKKKSPKSPSAQRSRFQRASSYSEYFLKPSRSSITASTLSTENRRSTAVGSKDNRVFVPAVQATSHKPQTTRLPSLPRGPNNLRLPPKRQTPC